MDCEEGIRTTKNEKRITNYEKRTTNNEKRMKRIFTYEEALALLPSVQELTREAAEKVEALTGGPSSGTGAEEMVVSEDSLPEVEQILAAWASSMLELGLEVKGLWLVDFDSGSGYYCWRYPEPALEFFHTYEEGFQGRVALN